MYVIDHGLSKRFVNDQTGLHIPIDVGQSFVGSIRYCSLNVTRGITPSRRDDCESVLYVLAEFGTGDLPWSANLGGRDVAVKVAKIKSEVNSEIIAQNMPQEFALLFQYVNSL